MIRLRIYSLIVIFAGLLAGAAEEAPANDISTQLKELRGIFAQNLQNIDVGFMDSIDKCRNTYAASLVSAEDAATKQGDLEGVLQIRKEKTRFANDRAVDDEIKPGTHPFVKQAIQSYLKGLESADSLRSQQIATLTSSYIKHLQAMQRKLTTQKKIEDALAVKAEIERIKSAPPDGEIGSNAYASDQDQCASCGGSGKYSGTCPGCKGSGKCSYCDGTGTRKVIGGKTAPCFGCNGNLKCRKCGGSGKYSGPCPDCGKKESAQ